MKTFHKLTDELQNLLESHVEWLLIDQEGRTFLLQTNEIEIEENHKKVLISFLDQNGFQTWRIVKCEIKKEKVFLELSRNFSKEESRIELIPRTKAGEFSETLELARLERANKIGRLISSDLKDAKLIRIELNKENGRFAQITIENKLGEQLLVLSDVSDSLTPEILLSSAIILFTKLVRRKKNPINEVWILGEKRMAEKLQKLHACLEKNWKLKIKIYEVSRKAAKNQNKENKAQIVKKKALQISNLWRLKPTRIRLENDTELSKISQEIVKLSPEKIDYLFSKNGEILRYLGLPFLRLRKTLEEEKTWFGIGRSRRILNENTYEDFYEMFENLKRYRCFDSPNKQHIFYDTSPEAWLESMLRNNIKQLDNNLILSPIYNQFRTSRDKIDLLALRKDGRLVIIELKVSADREMIFQAVDYWRKIELQRRKGMLKEAKLFGELEISDKPAIIYLVAPSLSFHKDFKIMSKTVSEDIEIFRFDLAENWRENLKVLGRRRV